MILIMMMMVMIFSALYYLIFSMLYTSKVIIHCKEFERCIIVFSFIYSTRSFKKNLLLVSLVLLFLILFLS